VFYSLGVLTLPVRAAPQAALDMLVLDWNSVEDDQTYAVAWGDVDNDGDLDLAVGNGNARQPSRVYLNQYGVLESVASWSSSESGNSYSLAWGDVDGDETWTWRLPIAAWNIRLLRASRPGSTATRTAA